MPVPASTDTRTVFNTISRQRTRRIGLIAVIAVTAASGTLMTTLHADAEESKFPARSTPDAIADSYVVVYKDTEISSSSVVSTSQSLGDEYGATLTAVRGFSATISRAKAMELAKDERVAYVEQNAVLRHAETQVEPVGDERLP